MAEYLHSYDASNLEPPMENRKIYAAISDDVSRTLFDGHLADDFYAGLVKMLKGKNG